MKEYTVLQPIKLGDDISKIGDVVKLSDKHAAELLELGCIELTAPVEAKAK